MSRMRHQRRATRRKRRKLADEELMQLVATATPAHLRSCSSATKTPPSRSPTACAARARPPKTLRRSRSLRSGVRGGAMTARAAACAHGRSASSTTARSTRCAARACTSRRRINDDGPREELEAPERTDLQAIDNAASNEIRVALGRATERSAACRRARLLRRLHPHRDLDHAEYPDRDGQGPDAPRA